MSLGVQLTISGECVQLYAPGCFSVLLSNAALGENPAELFQVMRALVLPWTALLDWWSRGNSMSPASTACVAAVTIGSIGAVITDVVELRTTLWGAVLGMSMVALAPVPTLLTKSVMKGTTTSVQLYERGSIVGFVLMTPWAGHSIMGASNLFELRTGESNALFACVSHPLKRLSDPLCAHIARLYRRFFWGVHACAHTSSMLLLSGWHATCRGRRITCLDLPRAWPSF